MAKITSRLLILILIGLCGYLYIQVVTLQKQNKQLTDQVNTLTAGRGDLLNRLSVDNEHSGSAGTVDNTSAPASNARQDSAFWIGKSREHIQLAEQSVSKGNFADAMKETRFSNLALSRAADQASAQTRQTVSELRSQVDQVQTKAKTLWHQFGG